MDDTTHRTPVVLDCDPGHDDALAILLANAELDLRAITTVAGNQTLAKVTDNTRRIATLAGIRDVPIAAGAERPLSRTLTVAHDVHGESGLDGADLPEPDVPLHEGSATELIAAVAERTGAPITLLATGPLTNVAALLDELPDPRSVIERIVVMGGSAGRGNVAPYAEFNIYVDPEAAATVFGSGLPVTMMGLDVTHQALVTDEVRERIRALGTPLARILADLLGFFAGTYRDIWRLPAPPLHDPVAVAYVIDPTLVECVDASVVVETEGEFTRGATVVDLHGRTGRPANARVGMRLDAERFWDLMIAAIAAHGREDR